MRPPSGRRARRRVAQVPEAFLAHRLRRGERPIADLRDRLLRAVAEPEAPEGGGCAREAEVAPQQRRAEAPAAAEHPEHRSRHDEALWAPADLACDQREEVLV